MFFMHVLHVFIKVKKHVFNVIHLQINDVFNLDG